MINIELTTDSNKRIIKVESIGHGDYDTYGKDIVCSAVSVYLINTINTLEEIIKVGSNINYNIDSGFYILNVNYESMDNNNAKDVELILNSLKLALESIKKEYKKYISLVYKEVQ